MTPMTRPERTRTHLAARWWRRRTLRARLSLLVTGAVATAVVSLAALAWLAVAEIQNHQTQATLSTDANAIAAQPDQWLAAATPLPDPNGTGGDHASPHQLGPRWQLLDANAAVISQRLNPLPVTAGARQVATGHRQRVEEHVTITGDNYLMLTIPAKNGAVQVAINQDADQMTLTLVGLLLAAGCALGIGGAGLLGRTVARAGLAPVQRLTEAVEDVAVTMDLKHPIEVRGVDEIARLGRSVNTMLGAIDSARRAQRALVEDASHELRTPLTSIRTNIELLVAVERHPELAHRLPPEDRAKLLVDLEAQVGELATLTTELVELAREEASREPVEPIELPEIVATAVARVRIRAPRLEFRTDQQPVTVQGRRGELERMLVNVLDNAAKWSPPGATVQVRLRAEGPDWCRLSVTDTGPGIDEADRPHVFDRFYRAATARALPGSGLGLAIVAQTVSQHGGTVSAEPHTPHGTVLTIRLPLAPVPPEPTTPRGGQ